MSDHATSDETPCGFLLTEPNGRIVRVNEMLLTISGFTRDELVGKKRFTDLLTGGGRIYYETHFHPLLQMQEEVRGIALEVVCGDGSRLPVLVNAVLERDAKGEPSAVRIAVFEATERRAYERELLRAKEEAEAAEAKSSALARTLQQTLIPPVAPTIPGLDVAAAYRPAGAGDEVGGDFYDAFQVDDDDWVIVVGDVQGKGAAAAVVTALVRHTVRAAAVLEQEPREILSTVNTVLLRDGTERFCTLGIVRLMRIDSTWRAAIGIGGHTLPVLCHGAHTPVQIGEPGMLIGVWETAETANTVVLLDRGDVLMLYTDGVTEARAGTEFFGEERLMRLASTHNDSAADLVAAVVEGAVSFQNGVTRDDIVVVAIGVPHE